MINIIIQNSESLFLGNTSTIEPLLQKYICWKSPAGLNNNFQSSLDTLIGLIHLNESTNQNYTLISRGLENKLFDLTNLKFDAINSDSLVIQEALESGNFLKLGVQIKHIRPGKGYSSFFNHWIHNENLIPENTYVHVNKFNVHKLSMDEALKEKGCVILNETERFYENIIWQDILDLPSRSGIGTYSDEIQTILFNLGS